MAGNLGYLLSCDMVLEEHEDAQGILLYANLFGENYPLQSSTLSRKSLDGITNEVQKVNSQASQWKPPLEN